MDKWIIPSVLILVLLVILFPWILIIYLSIIILWISITLYFGYKLPYPYLSIDEKLNIRINWYIKYQSKTSIKIINANSGLKKQLFPSSIIHNEYTGNYSIASELLDGLNPGEKYYYKIIQTNEKGKNKTLFKGKEYYFIVPKDRFPNDVDSIKIVSFGDLQPRSGTPPIIQWYILKKIKKTKPDLVLFLGDHTNEGTHPIAWRMFYNLVGPIIRNTPILGVAGNHDSYLNRNGAKRVVRDSYKTHVNYPNDKLNYILKVYGLTIIGLDFYEDFESNSNIVDEIRKEIENKRNDFFIILWHSSPHNTLKVGQNVKNLRKNVIPLFKEENKTFFWLGGHEHSYQHFIVNDIHYLTSAATSSFHKHRHNDIGLEKLVMKYHYLLINFNSKKFSIKSLSIQDEIIDEFEII